MNSVASFRPFSRCSSAFAKLARARGNERGWALVSVLWVLTLLALMAAAVQELTVTSARLEHLAIEKAELDSDFDVIVARAVLGITDTRLEQRWRVDGIPRRLTVNGVNSEIAVQDELGKFDLNAVDGSMLRRLLKSAGLSLDQASSLSDKILDWRSATDLTRLHGAADQDYEEAGYSYRPRHGPFQSVAEMRLVMGMTPELYAHISPALTVYTQKPMIDANVATVEALRALYLDAPAQADAILSARRGSDDADAASTAQPPSGLLDPAAVLGGRIFSVTATFFVGAQRFRRSATIELSGDDDRPYFVLAWQ